MSVGGMTASAEPTVSTAQRPPRAWRLRLTAGLVLPVGIALLWEELVRAGISDGRLVPPPSVIWRTLADLAATGELQRHVLATLARVAAGFGLGTLAGTFVGAVAGYWSSVRRIIDPTLQGLRSVPSIA